MCASLATSARNWSLQVPVAQNIPPGSASRLDGSPLYPSAAQGSGLLGQVEVYVVCLAGVCGVPVGGGVLRVSVTSM
jgi:hypothetical protein